MRKITLFAVISIFVLNRWYQILYDPEDSINLLYWGAKDVSGEMKCFIFALLALLNACSPKASLRERYIYLLMVVSAFFEVIDVCLSVLQLYDVINISWLPEFFYRFLSVLDSILFLFGFNYMITREYNFPSDKIEDKGVYFVFRQPGDPRSLLYGMFGKPISGVSVIVNGVWYKYDKYKGYGSKKLKILEIPDDFIVKKTPYKPTKEMINELKSLKGSKWSLIRNNCVLVNKRFWKMCGIDLKFFDFYPPVFVKRFLS